MRRVLPCFDNYYAVSTDDISGIYCRRTRALRGLQDHLLICLIILGCVLPLSKYSKVSRCLMKTGAFARGCRPIFDHRTRVRNGPYRGGSGREGGKQRPEDAVVGTADKTWATEVGGTVLQKLSSPPSSKRRPHAPEHTRATGGKQWGAGAGVKVNQTGVPSNASIRRPVQHVASTSLETIIAREPSMFNLVENNYPIVVFSGVTTTTNALGGVVRQIDASRQNLPPTFHPNFPIWFPKRDVFSELQACDVTCNTVPEALMRICMQT